MQCASSQVPKYLLEMSMDEPFYTTAAVTIATWGNLALIAANPSLPANRLTTKIFPGITYIGHQSCQ
jgi:hypothetical protein